MRKLNWIRIGFYASLCVLLLSVLVMLWPFVASFYFWQVTGLGIGIVGSAFFGMALAAQRNGDSSGEEP